MSSVVRTLKTQPTTARPYIKESAHQRIKPGVIVTSTLSRCQCKGRRPWMEPLNQRLIHASLQEAELPAGLGSRGTSWAMGLS
jgi:hypothetical protein